MEDLIITKWDSREEIPYDLLLLADESRQMVDDYFPRGECFVARFPDSTMVGLYVLLKTRPATFEILNIAVYEQFQGMGYGKELLQHAIGRAKELGASTVEIGTGNSGIGQLALYQKCGFRIVGVDSGFFLKHYPQPIVENGIPCVDMIRLRLEL
ncbi:MAG TPA: GNAT family N-acetyltransferase [Candidatus Bathyarchaeia archaeon]|nr:GNAT family N-acetyltransferase [Candidatus Bathyarchaeia archaeon]